jgi:ribosomal protein S18 acetylase RimI-like enzyme
MPDLPPGFLMDLATPEDIPALIWADLGANALFAPTGLIQPEALEQHVPETVLAEEIHHKNVIVIRREDQSPVGFAMITRRHQGLYLDQLSVHPDYGRRGLGRHLVLRVVHETEARHLPHVTLSTFRDLPWNGPFYASLGFVEINRKRYEPFMFAIEDAQRDYMDVTSRCFMRRPVRTSIFRRKGI